MHRRLLSSSCSSDADFSTRPGFNNSSQLGSSQLTESGSGSSEESPLSLQRVSASKAVLNKGPGGRILSHAEETQAASGLAQMLQGVDRLKVREMLAQRRRQRVESGKSKPADNGQQATTFRGQPAAQPLLRQPKGAQHALGVPAGSEADATAPDSSQYTGGTQQGTSTDEGSVRERHRWRKARDKAGGSPDNDKADDVPTERIRSLLQQRQRAQVSALSGREQLPARSLPLRLPEQQPRSRQRQDLPGGVLLSKEPLSKLTPADLRRSKLWVQRHASVIQRVKGSFFGRSSWGTAAADSGAGVSGDSSVPQLFPHQGHDAINASGHAFDSLPQPPAQDTSTAAVSQPALEHCNKEQQLLNSSGDPAAAAAPAPVMEAVAASHLAELPASLAAALHPAPPSSDSDDINLEGQASEEYGEHPGGLDPRHLTSHRLWLARSSKTTPAARALIQVQDALQDLARAVYPRGSELGGSGLGDAPGTDHPLVPEEVWETEGTQGPTQSGAGTGVPGPHVNGSGSFPVGVQQGVSKSSSITSNRSSRGGSSAEGARPGAGELSALRQHRLWLQREVHTSGDAFEGGAASTIAVVEQQRQGLQLAPVSGGADRPHPEEATDLLPPANMPDAGSNSLTGGHAAVEWQGSQHSRAGSSSSDTEVEVPSIKIMQHWLWQTRQPFSSPRLHAFRTVVEPQHSSTGAPQHTTTGSSQDASSGSGREKGAANAVSLSISGTARDPDAAALINAQNRTAALPLLSPPGQHGSTHHGGLQSGTSATTIPPKPDASDRTPAPSSSLPPNEVQASPDSDDGLSLVWLQHHRLWREREPAAGPVGVARRRVHGALLDLAAAAARQVTELTESGPAYGLALAQGAPVGTADGSGSSGLQVGSSSQGGSSSHRRSSGGGSISAGSRISDSVAGALTLPPPQQATVLKAAYVHKSDWGNVPEFGVWDVRPSKTEHLYPERELAAGLKMPDSLQGLLARAGDEQLHAGAGAAEGALQGADVPPSYGGGGGTAVQAQAERAGASDSSRSSDNDWGPALRLWHKARQKVALQGRSGQSSAEQRHEAVHAAAGVSVHAGNKGSHAGALLGAGLQAPLVDEARGVLASHRAALQSGISQEGLISVAAGSLKSRSVQAALKLKVRKGSGHMQKTPAARVPKQPLTARTARKPPKGQAPRGGLSDTTTVHAGMWMAVGAAAVAGLLARSGYGAQSGWAFGPLDLRTTAAAQAGPASGHQALGLTEEEAPASALGVEQVAPSTTGTGQDRSVTPASASGGTLVGGHDGSTSDDDAASSSHHADGLPSGQADKHDSFGPGVWGAQQPDALGRLAQAQLSLAQVPLWEGPGSRGCEGVDSVNDGRGEAGLGIDGKLAGPLVGTAVTEADHKEVGMPAGLRQGKGKPEGDDDQHDAWRWDSREDTQRVQSQRRRWLKQGLTAGSDDAAVEPAPASAVAPLQPPSVYEGFVLASSSPSSSAAELPQPKCPPSSSAAEAAVPSFLASAVARYWLSSAESSDSSEAEAASLNSTPRASAASKPASTPPSQTASGLSSPPSDPSGSSGSEGASLPITESVSAARAEAWDTDVQTHSSTMAGAVPEQATDGEAEQGPGQRERAVAAEPEGSSADAGVHAPSQGGDEQVDGGTLGVFKDTQAEETVWQPWGLERDGAVGWKTGEVFVLGKGSDSDPSAVAAEVAATGDLLGWAGQGQAVVQVEGGALQGLGLDEEQVERRLEQRGVKAEGLDTAQAAQGQEEGPAELGCEGVQHTQGETASVAAEDCALEVTRSPGKCALQSPETGGQPPLKETGGAHAEEESGQTTAAAAEGVKAVVLTARSYMDRAQPGDAVVRHRGSTAVAGDVSDRTMTGSRLSDTDSSEDGISDERAPAPSGPELLVVPSGSNVRKEASYSSVAEGGTEPGESADEDGDAEQALSMEEGSRVQEESADEGGDVEQALRVEEGSTGQEESADKGGDAEQAPSTPASSNSSLAAERRPQTTPVTAVPLVAEAAVGSGQACHPGPEGVTGRPRAEDGTGRSAGSTSSGEAAGLMSAMEDHAPAEAADQTTLPEAASPTLHPASGSIRLEGSGATVPGPKLPASDADHGGDPVTAAVVFGGGQQRKVRAASGLRAHLAGVLEALTARKGTLHAQEEETLPGSGAGRPSGAVSTDSFAGGAGGEITTAANIADHAGQNMSAAEGQVDGTHIPEDMAGPAGSSTGQVPAASPSASEAALQALQGLSEGAQPMVSNEPILEGQQEHHAAPEGHQGSRQGAFSLPEVLDAPTSSLVTAAVQEPCSDGPATHPAEGVTHATSSPAADVPPRDAPPKELSFRLTSDTPDAAPASASLAQQPPPRAAAGTRVGSVSSGGVVSRLSVEELLGRLRSSRSAGGQGTGRLTQEAAPESSEGRMEVSGDTAGGVQAGKMGWAQISEKQSPDSTQRDLPKQVEGQAWQRVQGEHQPELEQLLAPGLVPANLSSQMAEAVQSGPSPQRTGRTPSEFLPIVHYKGQSLELKTGLEAAVAELALAAGEANAGHADLGKLVPQPDVAAEIQTSEGQAAEGSGGSNRGLRGWRRGQEQEQWSREGGVLPRDQGQAGVQTADDQNLLQEASMAAGSVVESVADGGPWRRAVALGGEQWAQEGRAGGDAQGMADGAGQKDWLPQPTEHDGILEAQDVADEQVLQAWSETSPEAILGSQTGEEGVATVQAGSGGEVLQVRDSSGGGYTRQLTLAGWQQEQELGVRVPAHTWRFESLSLDVPGSQGSSLGLAHGESGRSASESPGEDLFGVGAGALNFPDRSAGLEACSSAQALETAGARAGGSDEAPAGSKASINLFDEGAPGSEARGSLQDEWEWVARQAGLQRSSAAPSRSPSARAAPHAAQPLVSGTDESTALSLLLAHGVGATAPSASSYAPTAAAAGAMPPSGRGALDLDAGGQASTQGENPADDTDELWLRSSLHGLGSAGLAAQQLLLRLQPAAAAQGSGAGRLSGGKGTTASMVSIEPGRASGADTLLRNRNAQGVSGKAAGRGGIGTGLVQAQQATVAADGVRRSTSPSPGRGSLADTAPDKGLTSQLSRLQSPRPAVAQPPASASGAGLGLAAQENIRQRSPSPGAGELASQQLFRNPGVPSAPHGPQKSAGKQQQGLSERPSHIGTRPNTPSATASTPQPRLSNTLDMSGPREPHVSSPVPRSPLRAPLAEIQNQPPVPHNIHPATATGPSDVKETALVSSAAIASAARHKDRAAFGLLPTAKASPSKAAQARSQPAVVTPGPAQPLPQPLILSSPLTQPQALSSPLPQSLALSSIPPQPLQQPAATQQNPRQASPPPQLSRLTLEGVLEGLSGQQEAVRAGSRYLSPPPSAAAGSRTAAASGTMATQQEGPRATVGSRAAWRAGPEAAPPPASAMVLRPGGMKARSAARAALASAAASAAPAAAAAGRGVGLSAASRRHRSPPAAGEVSTAATGKALSAAAAGAGQSAPAQHRRLVLQTTAARSSNTTAATTLQPQQHQQRQPSSTTARSAAAIGPGVHPGIRQQQSALGDSLLPMTFTSLALASAFTTRQQQQQQVIPAAMPRQVLPDRGQSRIEASAGSSSLHLTGAPSVVPLRVNPAGARSINHGRLDANNIHASVPEEPVNQTTSAVYSPLSQTLSITSTAALQHAGQAMAAFTSKPVVMLSTSPRGKTQLLFGSPPKAVAQARLDARSSVSPSSPRIIREAWIQLPTAQRLEGFETPSLQIKRGGSRPAAQLAPSQSDYATPTAATDPWRNAVPVVASSDAHSYRVAASPSDQFAHHSMHHAFNSVSESEQPAGGSSQATPFSMDPKRTSAFALPAPAPIAPAADPGRPPETHPAAASASLASLGSLHSWFNPPRSSAPLVARTHPPPEPEPSTDGWLYDSSEFGPALGDASQGAAHLPTALATTTFSRLPSTQGVVATPQHMHEPRVQAVVPPPSAADAAHLRPASAALIQQVAPLPARSPPRQPSAAAAQRYLPTHLEDSSADTTPSLRHGQEDTAWNDQRIPKQVGKQGQVHSGTSRSSSPYAWMVEAAEQAVDSGRDTKGLHKQGGLPASEGDAADGSAAGARRRWQAQDPSGTRQSQPQALQARMQGEGWVSAGYEARKQHTLGEPHLATQARAGQRSAWVDVAAVQAAAVLLTQAGDESIQGTDQAQRPQVRPGAAAHGGHARVPLISSTLFGDSEAHLPRGPASDERQSAVGSSLATKAAHMQHVASAAGHRQPGRSGELGSGAPRGTTAQLLAQLQAINTTTQASYARMSGAQGTT